MVFQDTMIAYNETLLYLDVIIFKAYKNDSTIVNSTYFNIVCSLFYAARKNSNPLPPPQS
jgi:hypothetical protein